MTAEIDLSKLSANELRDLRTKIAKQEDTNQREAKSKVMAALSQTAAEHGFKLSELFPNSPTPRVRAASGEKYRDPDNSENTWNGRGRQPFWFRKKIEAGVERSAMLIPQSN